MTKSLDRLQAALLLGFPAAAIFLPDRAHSYRVLGLTAAAWLILLLGLLIRRSPLPVSAAPRLAFGGLLALVTLTAWSLSWAGVLEPAASTALLGILYLGYVAAALPALRRRGLARLVEPTLAATIFATTIYSLSERILPRTFTLDDPQVAFGRLAAPLGYWNAMGLLCGLGLLLAVRIAGDTERSGLGRTLATACGPFLAAGLLLSFSRGAIAATLAGLFAVVAMAATSSQLRSSAIGLLSMVGVVAAVLVFPNVKDLEPPMPDRAADGLGFGLALLALSVLLPVMHSRLDRRFGGWERDRLNPTLKRTLAAAAVLLALAPFALVIIGKGQSTSSGLKPGANVSRLTSGETNRTKYWRVALDEFRSEPIHGMGAGSFAAAWTRRYGRELPARNAHSLEIETAGDLGLLGLAALGLLIAGLMLTARQGLRLDRRLAAGPAAGLLLFAAHSAIDWDWQVPGLMVPIGLLAATSIASADRERSGSHSVSRLVVGAVTLLVVVSTAWCIRGLVLEQRATRIADAAALLGWTDERYERARSDYQAAARLNPWQGARVGLIRAALQSGHTAEAIAATRTLADENPGSWFAWGLLSRVEAGHDDALANRAKAKFLLLRP